MDSHYGQARVNGDNYMKKRRPVILGLSLGNSHYFKVETLEKLFEMTERSTDKVLIFITDKISEHNYKAVGSKNPERSARQKGNALRNKCKMVMDSQAYTLSKYTFTNWIEDIDPNPQYRQALEYIENLYKNNETFYHDIKQLTKEALASLIKNRGERQEESIDLEEGAKYLLEELAFFSALHHIYDDCDEYVLVYHRALPVFDKFFEGFYDGQYRPSFGSYIFP